MRRNTVRQILHCKSNDTRQASYLIRLRLRWWLSLSLPVCFRNVPPWAGDRWVLVTEEGRDEQCFSLAELCFVSKHGRPVIALAFNTICLNHQRMGGIHILRPQQWVGEVVPQKAEKTDEGEGGSGRFRHPHGAWKGQYHYFCNAESVRQCLSSFITTQMNANKRREGAKKTENILDIICVCHAPMCFRLISREHMGA